MRGTFRRRSDDAVLRNEVRAVETEIKFAGYLEQQKKSIAKLKAAEAVAIPEWMEYGAISGLSREMRRRWSGSADHDRTGQPDSRRDAGGAGPGACVDRDCRGPGGWRDGKQDSSAKSLRGSEKNTLAGKLVPKPTPKKAKYHNDIILELTREC